MLDRKGARVYQFGEFELSEAEAELRTKDRRIPLQEKPLLLLLALVENSRYIVTRDQLRERLWDCDTFVDYEQGINIAIKKVRDALGDLPHKPRFIETVAKKGYRFLVPVEVGGSEVARQRLSTLPQWPSMRCCAIHRVVAYRPYASQRSPYSRRSRYLQSACGFIEHGPTNHIRPRFALLRWYPCETCLPIPAKITLLTASPKN